MAASSYRQYSFWLRWNGTILFEKTGVNYSGGHLQRLRVNKKPSFEEAISVFKRKMPGVEDNVIIERITYRCPVFSNGEIVAYYGLPIFDNSGLNVLYHLLDVNPAYDCPELYFEFQNAIKPMDRQENAYIDVGEGGSVSYTNGSNNVGAVVSSTSRTLHRQGIQAEKNLPRQLDRLGDDNMVNSESDNDGDGFMGEMNDEDGDVVLPNECHPTGLIPSDISIGGISRQSNIPIGDIPTPLTILGGGIAGTSRVPPLGYTPPGIGEMMMVNNDYQDIEQRQAFDATRDAFYVGQMFGSKMEAQVTINTHVVSRQFQTTTMRSRPWELEKRCLNHKTSGCPWMIRVTNNDHSGVWTITQLNSGHAKTCTRKTHAIGHKQLDVDLIADCVMHMLHDRPHLRIALVQAEVKKIYARQISYRKAWYGKQHAMSKIYGDWEESYNLLPTFLYAVQRWNPGTQIEFRTENVIVDGVRRRKFKSVFWSWKPSIDGFVHCPPVLLVDGTFLTGKYSGFLLMASSLDGNHHIFTVAFAIVDKDSIDNWMWFMDCVQKYVTNKENVCVISDKHAGIRAAMANIGRGWIWRWCLRHYANNYNSVVKKPPMKKRLQYLGMENSIRKFNKGVTSFVLSDEQQRICKPNWVTDDQLFWSQAMDSAAGGARYGMMTTNIAESMNNTFKGICALPVCSLVQHTFYRLVDFFVDRRKAYNDQLDPHPLIGAPKVWTQLCREIMAKRAVKAMTHSIQKDSLEDDIYEVKTAANSVSKTGDNMQRVHFNDIDGTGECTCGKFQQTKMPCSHAIAVCNKCHGDPYFYVHPFYRLENCLKIYGTSFVPVGGPKDWESHQEVKIIPDTSLLRTQGRP